MQRIFITHQPFPQTVQHLEADFEVSFNSSRSTLPRSEVLEQAHEADALMVFMPDRIDEDFLAQCPYLKVIGAALKGYDNFDIEACWRRGIWFTNVPDLLSESTAELALALLLGLSRNLRAGDAWVRSGKFVGWQPQFYGQSLSGKTVGILGMGGVGKALAQRLYGFDCRVIYHDKNPLSPELEHSLHLTPVDLPALLEFSDVLFPLLHLTPTSLHLFNAEILADMKPGSFLINVARGSLVDEAAVLEALNTRHLAGYGADVFEMEDWALEGRPYSISSQLLGHPNTLFTPHLGSAVESVRQQIELRAAENIRQALLGKKPMDAVLPQMEKTL